MAKVERWVAATPGKRQQGSDGGCGSTAAAGLSSTDIEDLRVAAALVARDAAGRGDMWALRQLHEKGWRMTQGELGAAALAAASARQVAVLKWMVSTFGTVAGQVVDEAVGVGEHEQQSGDGGAPRGGAQAGGLGAPLLLSVELMAAAAGTGFLSLMQMVHGWGCPLGPEVAAAAIKGCLVATRAAAGKGGAAGGCGLSSAAVPLLQWLMDRGCVLAHVAVRVAAVRRGEVALLAWLDGHGCGGGWGAEELGAAVELGCGEVLMWLAEYGAVKAYNAAVDGEQERLARAGTGVGTLEATVMAAAEEGKPRAGSTGVDNGTLEADGGGRGGTGGGGGEGVQGVPVLYRAAAAAGDVAMLWCLQQLGVRVGPGDGAEGALPPSLLLLAPGVRAWLKEQRAVETAAKGGTRGGLRRSGVVERRRN